MKKKDIASYNKSQEITKEVIRAMKGDISKEGSEKLATFIDENKYSLNLISKLSDEKEFAEKHKKLENIDENINSFYQKLDNCKSKKKKFSLIRIILTSSATAAVIVLSVLLYYEREKTIVLATKDVEKPLLVLSDGNKIDLESTDKNILEKEDLVIRKINNNEIKYSNSPARNKTTTKNNRLIIPKKYNYVIALCDGTEVHLNANSLLEYPENFAGDTREVKLDGEAYFKVKKSTIPFVVKVNNALIKVYGTEFNINTNYENNIETTLISGSVGVKPENEKEILISPNQMISIDKKTNKSIVKNVEVDNYISWKSGFFRYANYDFASVMSDIAQWYGVKIKISDKIKNENRLTTLSISREIPIEEVVRFIEKLMDVTIIDQEGGNYRIE